MPYRHVVWQKTRKRISRTPAAHEGRVGMAKRRLSKMPWARMGATNRKMRFLRLRLWLRYQKDSR